MKACAMDFPGLGTDNRTPKGRKLGDGEEAPGLGWVTPPGVPRRKGWGRGYL